jgi:hypothetical protein
VEGPAASFTGDGAYDQDSVYRTVTERDPDAAVIVPPRSTAVASETADTDPPLTFQLAQDGQLEPLPASPPQRDCHLRCIDEKGRIGWQKVSDHNKRSRVEAAIGRYKQVIGNGLRFRKDGRRTTEISVSVYAGARTPDLRPHHMNSDRVGDAATHSSIDATTPRSPFRF